MNWIRNISKRNWKIIHTNIHSTNSKTLLQGIIILFNDHITDLNEKLNAISLEFNPTLIILVKENAESSKNLIYKDLKEEL